MAIPPTGRSPGREVTPRVYVGLQAIVQGVSLAILTEQTFGLQRVKHGLGLQGPTISVMLFALACLSYVIYIAFEYMMLYADPLAETEINALDVVIIFVLGIFEYIPMYQLRTPIAWAASVLLLAICGILAFERSFWQINHTMVEGAQKSRMQLYTIAAQLLLTVFVFFLGMMLGMILIVRHFFPEYHRWVALLPPILTLAYCGGATVFGHRELNRYRREARHLTV